MSKKSKNKKRRRKERLKRLRAQLLAQQQSQTQVESTPTKLTPKTPALNQVTEQKPEVIEAIDPEEKNMRKELKKYFLISLLITIILVALGLIMNLTTWINPVKDWIAKIV